MPDADSGSFRVLLHNLRRMKAGGRLKPARTTEEMRVRKETLKMWDAAREKDKTDD